MASRLRNALFFLILGGVPSVYGEGGPSPATGLPDDPLAALNVLRWAAGLEPLQSDDVD